jgi:PPOX class probable F420-dependent enzyme
VSRLTEQKICWIATTRPDGKPHLSPIWYVWLDDRIWLCCWSGSVKARNLRADPRVSFSLQEGGDPLVAEGAAALHGRPFPPHVSGAFLDAFDWDIETDAAGETYDCLVEITVDRWLMGDPGV